MLFAALFFPQLPLDGLLRQHPNPDHPIALITGPINQRVLLDVNAAGRAHGLRPGQSLNAARAMLQDFAAVDHRPAEDHHLLNLVLHLAYRYSSMVAPEGDDCIVLEVAASLRLFGPWPRLEQHLRADLKALGITAQIALAPTSLAARALASAHDGIALTHTAPLRRALAALALTHTRVPPAHAHAMHAMGIRRLGQLFDLPRDALAKRFSRDLLLYLDRLLGQIPDPRTWYSPPDCFDARIEFHHEVILHPALLFPLKRLLNDLAAVLVARDGGVQRFVIQLEHEGHADTEIVMGLLQTERDPLRLFDLSKLKLEQTRVPAPVRGMRVRATELPPFIPLGRDLFEPRAAAHLDWQGLCERLRARLGEHAVQQIEVRPDPRPERAVRFTAERPRQTSPAQNPASPALYTPALNSPAFNNTSMWHRPLWLLPDPIPLRDWQLEICSPVERIESGWWDGFDVQRDYHLVRTSSGQLAWAFRANGSQGHDWMLHGWFA